MYRDVSSCNTYNYGDALYWDARYGQEAGPFDWYQRYSALRPFLRKYVPSSARVLMVGCGNAVMSEDMVKDGYEDIMNIDISSVAIDMMRKKYEHIPHLKYMQMDVRDMSFFPDESFDSIIDKGTLDSLMCGTSAQLSAAQMLGEVSRFRLHHLRSLIVNTDILRDLTGIFYLRSFLFFISFLSQLFFLNLSVVFFACRLLKPGGTYILITYGDPTVRIPHLNRAVYSWEIILYIISRPGFQRPAGSCSSSKSFAEPVPISEKGLLPAGYVLEDPDSHYIYVCKKIDEIVELESANTHLETTNVDQ